MQHLEVSGAVRHIYVIRRLKVNVLIQFFVSSTCTCFESHVFIIRKTISTWSFLWYVMVCSVQYRAQLFTC